MRHFRSILYALVLAPAVWVLVGVGLTHDLTARGRDGFAVESLTGLVLLLLGGAAYGILVFAPISPLGPFLTGLVFLGVGAWAIEAPAGYAKVWPGAVVKAGFDLSRPGYGLAALLSVPMILTVLSVRRWTGFQPVVLPFIGPVGRARVAGTPVAALETAVLPAPAEAGWWADFAPSRDGDESTAVLRLPGPEAPADRTTLLPRVVDDESTTIFSTQAARPTSAVDRPVVKADEQPTADVAEEPPTADVLDEQPTADVADQQPTADIADEPPTADMADQQPTTNVADEQPTTDMADRPPTTDVADETPTADIADETPTTDIVDKQPIADMAEEQPTEDVRDEPPTANVADARPAEDLLDEPPTTAVNSEPPTETIHSEPPTERMDRELTVEATQPVAEVVDDATAGGLVVGDERPAEDVPEAASPGTPTSPEPASPGGAVSGSPGGTAGPADETSKPEDVRVILAEDGAAALERGEVVVADETTFLPGPRDDEELTQVIRLPVLADGERTQVIRPIGHEPGQTTLDLGQPGESAHLVRPAAGEPGESTHTARPTDGGPGESTPPIPAAAGRAGESTHPTPAAGRPAESTHLIRPTAGRTDERIHEAGPGETTQVQGGPGETTRRILWWTGNTAGPDETQVVHRPDPAGDERTEVIDSGERLEPTLVKPPGGGLEPVRIPDEPARPVTGPDTERAPAGTPEIPVQRTPSPVED